MTRVTAAALIALLLLALAPIAPAAAQPAPGGTILYSTPAGEIIAAAPDGSASHVVASGDWGNPTMADDGTILAVRGRDEIVRMTQSGRIIDSFFPSENLGSIYDLEVSADGQYVAWASITLCNRPSGEVDSCRNTHITYADGRNPDSLGQALQSSALTFVPGGPQPVVAMEGLSTITLGSEDAETWYDRGLVDVSDLDVSADGSLLAVAGCNYEGGDFGLECFPQIEFHLMGGLPPAQPTAVQCFVSNAEELVSYDDVSFSPDGSAFAITERPDERELGDARVQVYTGFTAEPCGATGPIEIADGGGDVFWGAAPYDPTDDGDPTDPGPVDPGDPGDPAGTIRIDGGGSADPVGQAVATSASLFEDGAASRVVLATADRFPDALAGAALAGTRGPILLTPSAGALDPRVAAEIARVTGGDGQVLVLGGEAAVSQAAADQARAAAGNRPCASPLPTSCRYAGTGREDTAAQIAATVLAENPGTSRALLARGDAFADAITGGAYAARAGVPILLTPSGSLAAQTRAFLQANPSVDEVVVLGGEAAVSQAVAQALPVATVGRVAGADRTATSAAIATQLWQAEGLAGGGVVVVNVRSDRGWQTALTAAVVSAAVGAPQLGVEGPPAAPTQAVLDAARVVGTSQVITFGGADLVGGGQLAAIQAAG